MGHLQKAYEEAAINLRSRYSQTKLLDITDSEEINFIILTEHKRAHRNFEENKIQIIKKYYWPQMRASIKKTVEKCKTCQVAKYTRHPDKPLFQDVPIPTRAMQILQIDLYTIEQSWFITAIDCFTKFAIIKPIKSRARIDIENPLFEILTQITIPEVIVIDNEPSLKTEVIRSKLDEYNIKVYETPTGRSEVNGQVERLHSTITEIYRCLKTENVCDSPADRIKLSVDKYNNSIHSVINMTPCEALIGPRNNTETQSPSTANQQREINNEIILNKLRNKQKSTRDYQNKNRNLPINYNQGDLALIKNKQIISKHVNPKKIITVRKNNRVTVLDSKGSKFHKTDLKKFKS
jgi:hypothetical protein